MIAKVSQPASPSRLASPVKHGHLLKNTTEIKGGQPNLHPIFVVRICDSSNSINRPFSSNISTVHATVLAIEQDRELVSVLA